MRSVYSIGIAYLFVAMYALWRGPASSMVVVRPSEPVQAVAVRPGTGAAGWFQTIKPFCNAVEVSTALRQQPAPAGVEGVGFQAACLSLAGRITEARAAIMTLAPAERWKAAGIVFEVGHPVADAGDDQSAGPIMGLVVEFWPNHYMALYHAGAARYATKDYRAAREHLTEFLKYYQQNDGWTGSARGMLDAIARR